MPRHRIALALAALCALAGIGHATAGPGRTVDKWALLVGIDKHQGKTHSNVGSVGDTQTLRDVLLRNGWPANHIKVLNDSAATQAGIRAGMKWLVDNSGPDSFSVFHYSGHTKQIKGDPDRDGEALDEFLWPSDNRHISDGEFASYMKRLRGWAWINIAACEAAGFNDGVASPHRLFTASSLENEKSYEMPQWKNSLFVGLLAEQGIQLRRAPDKNRDKAVSIQEAFEYARYHAPRVSSKQDTGPQHPYIAGGDGKPWFFTVPLPPRPFQCKLLVDKAGDAKYYGTTVAPSYVDIVGADIATGPNTVTGVIRLASLQSDIRGMTGVEYRLGFDMGGTKYQMVANRSTLNGDKFSLIAPTAAGTRLVDITGTFNEPSKEIRMVAPRASFPTNPNGRWFSRLTATSYNSNSSGSYMGLDLADTATSSKTYLDRDPSCVRPA